MPQYTRCLALGDSETYGARATHGRTYPTILEEQLSELHTNVPSIVINAGVNGERSWEIVDRGVGHLLSDEWIKIVLCMMGTNDSKPGSNTPIDLYMAQWDRLLRACRATDTMLYPLEIHAIDPVGQPEYDALSNAKISEFNAHVKDWASQNGLIYIDGLHEPFRADKTLLADGIHPTNEGNDIIASRIAEFLSVPLASRRTEDVETEPQRGLWGGPAELRLTGIASDGTVKGTMINGNGQHSAPAGAPGH